MDIDIVLTMVGLIAATNTPFYLMSLHNYRVLAWIRTKWSNRMSVQAEIKDLQERVTALESLIDANFSESSKAAWSKAADDAAEIDSMSSGSDTEKKKTSKKGD